jgi:NTE family protein
MKIGLVLGGGGSRGIAHIGVLEVLKREEIQVDLIVGTSMGGIVGTHFALGIPPEVLAKRMRQLQNEGLIKLTRFTMQHRQRVLLELLQEGVGEKTFNDLKIDTILMAVDMIQGVEIQLKEGRLIDAILATSAIPSIFPPVQINGKYLADGGVIDSLATHVAVEAGVDLMIAVDLYPELDENNPWADPISAITGIQLPFIYRATAPIKPPNSLSSMWRAVRVMSSYIHQLRLNESPPDILMRPEVDSFGSMDFKDIEGPYQAGISEAERHVPAIKEMLQARA